MRRVVGVAEAVHRRHQVAEVVVAGQAQEGAGELQVLLAAVVHYSTTVT